MVVSNRQSASVRGASEFVGLLGSAYYEPATLQAYTIAATTLAAIDTTNLTVGFIAPSSGTVVVELEGLVGVVSGSTAESLYWALFSHGTTTQVGYTTQAMASNDASIYARVQATIRITGLTYGTTNQIDWAWCTNSGSQSYGMYVQTVTGPSVGPAIMRVYAD